MNDAKEVRKGPKGIDLDSLSLSDNAVMTLALTDNPRAVKAILAPILGRDDFEISDVVTQRRSELVEGHSVVFDCVATFADGTKCDIEMQKSMKGMNVERMLFYEAMLTASALKKGQDYEEMRPTILVVLGAGDFLGQSKPLRVFRWHDEETKKAISGKQTIYLADLRNGDMDTELGRLMADLRCPTPERIANTPLRETLSMVKWKQGGELMNQALWELYDDAIAEGRAKGLEQGLAEGRAKGLEQGRAEGRELVIVQLIRDGELPLAVGARTLGLSEEELLRRMEERK